MNPSFPRRLFASLLALASVGADVSHGGVPIPENFPGATFADTPGPVAPLIPIAKVLILPITAADPDGNRIIYTATSDNPAVMVRVKTGNPLMKITIQHNGDGTAADPAYPASGESGDVVFQLFRDATPQTAENIAGFAEAAFYKGLIFHRLADLNDPMDPSKPAPAVSSFIFQGGDPMGTGSGSIGFAYDNEQDASLIFAGRGQLAMANSGLDSTGHGTNGSQFFITYDGVTLNSNGTVKNDGRPRALDMGYTIFGQVTHGWTMLDHLRNTPRWPYPPNNSDGTGGTAPTGETPDMPKTPVTITASSVSGLYQPDPTKPLAYTDAVLVLSATAPATAHITVTMSDNQTPPNKVTKTFEVLAAKDTTNTKPFLTQLGNHFFDKDTEVPVPSSGSSVTQQQFDTAALEVLAKHPETRIPFRLVDLERDYVSLAPELINNTSSFSPIGVSTLISHQTIAILGNSRYQNTTGAAGYTGVLDAELAATQFDMTYRGRIDGAGRGIDSLVAGSAVVGHPTLVTEPIVLSGVAGTALTGVTVATFKSGNTRAVPADLVATINWGDPLITTASNGTITTKAAFAADAILPSTTPSASEFTITGTHTYAHPGTYRVTVTLADSTAGGRTNLGLDLTIQSTAVISAGTLTAAGREISFKSQTPASQVLATFTDTSAGGSYTSDVDWGDGLVSPALVRAMGNNQFRVEGSHHYRDPETFATLIRVHRTGGSTASDALAWGKVHVSGFTGQQHLPPFDQAHLVAALSPVISGNTAKLTKTIVGDIDHGNSQTYLTYQIIILNSGNKPSKAGKLRLYLSADKKLNLTPTLNSDGSLASPADIPLNIGSSHSDALIAPIAAGNSVTYYFDDTALGDLRLVPPPNETCSGYNLLANLEYSDPIADNEPIDKSAVAGKITGLIVEPTFIQTSESGTPAHFSVRLDKPPGTDLKGNAVTVVVPLTSSSTTTATVTPASLTFDNLNWNQFQTVTVVGKPDSTTTTSGVTYNPANGGTSFSVSVGPATSGGLLDGIVGDTVTGNDSDIGRNILAQSTTIATTDPYGANPTKTFIVTLVHAPTAPVTVTLHAALPTTSSTGTISQEGLLSAEGSAPAESLTLTFPAIDSAHPGLPPPLTKTVTVTGLDDGSRGGSSTYNITFDPSTSDDPAFNEILVTPVPVINQHTASALTLSGETVTTTDPHGAANTATFNVVLDKAPASAVTVTLTAKPAADGAPEGKLSANGSTPDSSVTLSFNPTSALKQTVTVTGLDDGTTNNSVDYTITATPAISTDAHFNGKQLPTIYATNEHLASIFTSVESVTTSDPRGTENTASFNVTLGFTPTADVSLTLTAQPSGNGQIEGLLSANGSTPAQVLTLLFKKTDLTFSQTVTVTGQDDGSTSGVTNYQITFAAPVTGDTRINTIPDPISATNQHFP